MFPDANFSICLPVNPARSSLSHNFHISSTSRISPGSASFENPSKSVPSATASSPEVEHVHIGFQYRCFPVQKMPSKQSCLKGISFFLKASAFIVSYIIKNSRNIRHPRINRPENYIFRTLLLLGYQVLRDLRERFHNIPGGS